MEYPYGKAPLVILLLAIVASLGIAVSAGESGKRPDIVFCVFAKEHVGVYHDLIEDFEKKHNVKVQLQLVDQGALKTRLQSAMQAGADVPDMVEILDGTLGTFTAGPLKDVDFVDLTDRIRAEGLDERLVKTRFGKWTSRGRIFALPHDVHPVMLCYRKDVCEELGIDVSKLDTWDKFCAAGREMVERNRGPDGVPKRYMIDLMADGSDHLRLLYLQAGGAFFTPDGSDTCFDNPIGVRVIDWYVHQTGGAGRISFWCGWGQNLSQAMNDGLCLFYLSPDWRTKSFQQDVPGLSGKLALMPMPAWDEGARRTTTWGGTGLAFTRAGKNFPLAWELAMTLYYSKEGLGKRFQGNNILPPVKAAWSEPEFSEARPFFGGIPLGKAYAELAVQIPPEQSSAYSDLARDKFSEAFINASLYYKEHGEEGLDKFTEAELKRRADDVRSHMRHNIFLASAKAEVAK